MSTSVQRIKNLKELKEQFPTCTTQEKLEELLEDAIMAYGDSSDEESKVQLMDLIHTSAFRLTVFLHCFPKGDDFGDCAGWDMK